jgi:hypothetical protein
MFNAGIIASSYLIPPSAVYLDTYVSPSNIRQCYSLKRLISTYSGSAIRVRRSSDNTEQDIGFVGDVLDTASLSSFVGAGSGFVRTWYDQSSNANHIGNSATSAQPRIVNGGVYDGDVVFDGTDDTLFNTSITILNNVRAFVFSRMQVNKAGSGAIYMALSSGYADPTFDAAWSLYYDPRSSGIATPAYSVGLTDGDGSGPTTIIENFGFSGGAPDLSASSTIITLDFNGTNSTPGRIGLYANGTFYDGNMQSEGVVGTTMNPSNLYVGSLNGSLFFQSMRANSIIVCANNQSAVRTDVEGLL